MATAVDTEKIRPTSLPWRTMAITTAVVIAVLAVAGFVYGKLRSRPPGVKKAPAATASPAPPAAEPRDVDAPPTETSLPAPLATPLPPPQVQPLPPPEPVSEWAPPTV